MTTLGRTLLLASAAIASPLFAQLQQSSAAVIEATPARKLSFLPAGFEAPTLVETTSFKVVPLGPDLVEVDFDAYMSSIEHLQRTFTRSTDWPHKNISHTDAMRDMEAEQARFKNRQSFAYAVLTPDGGRERGAVYIAPSIVNGYDAVVRMWVTKAEYDAGFDAELHRWVANWLKTDWPFRSVAYPGRAIDWDKWESILARSTTETHVPERTAPETMIK